MAKHNLVILSRRPAQLTRFRTPQGKRALERGPEPQAIADK